MRQGAQGWCTGMTLRDGMGREMGGAFRMGTHMSACTLCLSKPICLEKLAIFSFTSIFPILEGNRAGFVSWCPVQLCKVLHSHVGSGLEFTALWSSSFFNYFCFLDFIQQKLYKITEIFYP